jgi:hypothetical protein
VPRGRSAVQSSRTHHPLRSRLRWLRVAIACL